MNLLMKWFQKRTIKEQIQMAILSLAILSTLLLGVSSYFLSKNIIEQNYKDDFSYNLEISNEVMNIQLDNVIVSTRDLLSNSNFISILKESGKSEAKYFTSTQSHNLETVLGKVVTQEPLIVQVMVLDKTGKLYSYTSNSLEGDYYKVPDIKKEVWINEIEQAQGKEVFYSKNILNPDKEKKSVYMAKYLIDPSTYEGVGYLVVNIRDKIFDKAFGSAGSNTRDNFFMVVNQKEENHSVYFRGKDDYKNQIEAEYFKNPAGGKEFIFASVENDITGWQLVSIADKSELTKDSNIIGGVILLFICCLIILGMAISRLISGRIYEPLRKVEDIIEEVGEGKRNITEEFDESEIGQIGNKFKKMVNHNLELRERLLSSSLKERESELLLLQSQINPHFLYNTLDSLYCMAIIQEMDDMAQMVDALSRTFRLSLNKGNKLILVKDEMEHIKSYMEVQNFRFNHRFMLDLNIAEELEEIYILKFILQPFVENAMYHGLESKMGKGFIKVTGVKAGDKIVFTVEDDGVGMEDLSVLKKGYAVQNVKERIQLYYGEKNGYGVEFASEPGIGTKVTVTVGISYQGGEILNEKRDNC